MTDLKYDLANETWLDPTISGEPQGHGPGLIVYKDGGKTSYTVFTAQNTVTERCYLDYVDGKGSPLNTAVDIPLTQPHH